MGRESIFVVIVDVAAIAAVFVLVSVRAGFFFFLIPILLKAGASTIYGHFQCCRIVNTGGVS